MRPRAMLRVQFMVGADLKDALKEAKSLAARMNLAFVDFTFNGKEFSISQEANLAVAEAEYERGSGYICT